MEESPFKPPRNRSMSDAELELALEDAKKLPDGMLSAMMLLEEQSQIRAEDEAKFAQWVEQMKANPSIEAKVALAELGLGAFPEQPIAHVFEASPEPEVLETVEHLEVPAENIEPEGLAPWAEAELTFDELLAAGAAEATASIHVVQTQPEPEIEQSPAIESAHVADSVLADEDFSVTAALNTIVSRVEQSFSADEEALIDEETEHLPVAAPSQRFEPVSLETVHHEHSGSAVRPSATSWSIVALTGLIGPLSLSLWAKAQNYSLASLWLASAVGFALVALVRAGFASWKARGDHSVSVLSRASFGVFGNIVPSLFNLAARVLALVVTVWLLANSANGLIVGLPELSSTYVSLSLNSWMSLAIVVIAFGLIWVRGKLRTVLAIVVMATCAVWLVAVMAISQASNLQAGSIDIAKTVLLVAALLGFGILSFGFADSENEVDGTTQPNPLWFTIMVWWLVPVVATLAISTYLSGLKFAGGFAFADFIFSAPNWIATATIAAFAVGSVWLVRFALNLISESLVGFFVKQWWLRSLIALVLAAGAILLFNFVPVSATLCVSLLPIALVPVFAFSAVALSENFIRHGRFHDVSLRKGYAFYRKVGIFAIVGYLALLLLGVELVENTGLPIFGLLSSRLYSVMFFGAFSPFAIVFLGSLVWTFITAIPRILKQEREIASVEERRTQIAGVELSR